MSEEAQSQALAPDPMPDGARERITTWFAYRVSCAAHIGARAAAQEFFTSARATPETRLKQAGYTYYGGFEAHRCRIEPDRLVLAGRIWIDEPKYGWRDQTPALAAHIQVSSVVRWTLATLYHCRDMHDHSDPEDLDLRLRAVVPTAANRAERDRLLARWG